MQKAEITEQEVDKTYNVQDADENHHHLIYEESSICSTKNLKKHLTCGLLTRLPTIEIRD